MCLGDLGGFSVCPELFCVVSISSLENHRRITEIPAMRWPHPPRWHRPRTSVGLFQVPQKTCFSKGTCRQLYIFDRIVPGPQENVLFKALRYRRPKTFFFVGGVLVHMHIGSGALTRRPWQDETLWVRGLWLFEIETARLVLMSWDLSASSFRPCPVFLFCVVVCLRWCAFSSCFLGARICFCIS